MFGGGDRVAVRRVHHNDTTNGRGGNVDVVNAHSGTADDAQSVGGVKQIRGHFRLAAYDQTVAVLECLDQFGRLQSWSFPYDETCGAQWSKSTLADVVCHENLCRHNKARYGNS